MKNVLNDDEDERELAVDRRRRPCRRSSTGIVVAARLLAQLRRPSPATQSMPWTSTPARGERDRDPAGADAELEHATAGGELGERAHLRRRVRRRVPLVVDVGDALAVGFRPVVFHRPIVSRSAREVPVENRRRADDHRPRRRARARAPARSARLRRHLQLRRPARPVLPAAARGRAHGTGRAHDRGRDRVRAHPDDARAASRTTCSSRRRAASTSGSARRSSRTSRSASRCRGRSPAARMRELVLAIRAIWASVARGHAARLPRRVLHAHVDDAVLQSRPEPVRPPAHLPRRRRPADDRGRGRGRRRLHDPPVLDRRSSCARRRSPRSTAASPRTRSHPRRLRDRVPGDDRRGRDRRGARGRASTRCAPRLAFYGSTPAYKVVLDAHGWGDLQPELNRLSKRGDWATMVVARSPTRWSTTVRQSARPTRSRQDHRATATGRTIASTSPRQRGVDSNRHLRPTAAMGRRRGPRQLPDRLYTRGLRATSRAIARTNGPNGRLVLRRSSSKSLLRIWGLPLPFSDSHDLAHEEAVLLLLDLVVAGAVLVDDGRVRREHVVDDRGERAFVAHLREAASPRRCRAATALRAATRRARPWPGCGRSCRRRRARRARRASRA